MRYFVKDGFLVPFSISSLQLFNLLYVGEYYVPRGMASQHLTKLCNSEDVLFLHREVELDDTRLPRNLIPLKDSLAEAQEIRKTGHYMVIFGIRRYVKGQIDVSYIRLGDLYLNRLLRKAAIDEILTDLL